MKTINFYSYKGGVGRTMLTAQVARILAALGKRVVIVDFDFDAPGIPSVFGYSDQVKGGTIDLVKEFLIDSKQRRIKEFENKLRSFLINVDIRLRGGAKGKEEEGNGSIQILPCGDSNGNCDIDTDGNNSHSNYWNTITDIPWMRLLTAGPEGNCPSLVDYFAVYLENVLDVDYILIDSRAGRTHYGRVARQVSSVQVVVYCPNKEARNILLKKDDYLSINPRNAPKLEKLAFVVSRTPRELIQREDYDPAEEGIFLEEQTQIEETFGDISPDERPVLRLRSDLATHLDPAKRNIDERYLKKGKEELVQLHEDILEIVSELCGNDIVDLKDTKAEERPAKIWALIYGYPFAISHQNRLFGFQKEGGAMFNPGDGNRNVAFKVVTFLNLLNQFYETLMITSDTREESVKNLTEALSRAGEECGAAFGAAFAEQQGIDDREMLFSDIKQHMDIWCKFDTDAGFGHMEYCDADKTLTVTNLFIMDSVATRSRDYTAFFTGYVVGVLNSLTGPHELTSMDMRKIKHNGDVRGDYHPVYDGNKLEYNFPKISHTTNIESGIRYKLEIKDNLSGHRNSK